MMISNALIVTCTHQCTCHLKSVYSYRSIYSANFSPRTPILHSIASRKLPMLLTTLQGARRKPLGLRNLHNVARDTSCSSHHGKQLFCLRLKNNRTKQSLYLSFITQYLSVYRLNTPSFSCTKQLRFGEFQFYKWARHGACWYA